MKCGDFVVSRYSLLFWEKSAVAQCPGHTHQLKGVALISCYTYIHPCTELLSHRRSSSHSGHLLINTSIVLPPWENPSLSVPPHCCAGRSAKSFCSLKLKIMVIVSLISSAGAFKDTVFFITSLYPLPTFFFFSRLLLWSVCLHPFLLLDCLDAQRVPLICSHHCHRSSMKACGRMNAVCTNNYLNACCVIIFHQVEEELNASQHHHTAAWNEQNDLWGDFYVRQMQVCCVLSALPWITFPFIVSVGDRWGGGGSSLLRKWQLIEQERMILPHHIVCRSGVTNLL